MNIEIPPVTDPESKIIDLRGGPIAIRLTEAPEKYCESQHRNILIDEHERSVYCRECGKEMDPFDYLLGWAKKGDNRMGWLKSLENEQRKLSHEIEAMKAVLAREKAKVRKVNPDAPEVMTWKRHIAQQRQRQP